MPLDTLSHTHGYHGSDESGDHELQVDIMRFLAILALCLMAVFALVQGMPQAGEADETDKRAALRVETEALLKRVQALHAQQLELSSEQEQMQDSRKLAQNKLSQTEMRLRTVEYRLKRSGARLQQLSQMQSAQTQAISSLQRRRDSEEKELLRVEQRLTEVREELDRRQRALKTTPPPVKKPASAPVQAVALKPEPEAIAESLKTQPEPPRPVAAPAHDPDPEGFSLHFASAGTLRQLVAQGRVGFYARLPEGFWQLNIDKGRERYAQTQSPGSFYAMTADTVPAGFRTALVRSTGHPADGKVTWGVTLPADIASRVQTRMAEQRGGILIIDSNGAVNLGRRSGT